MLGLKEITSKDNSLIKLVCELQRSSKKRKETGLFVLEGLRITKDALDNSIEFDKIIVSRTALERYEQDIENLLSRCSDAYLLTDNLFKKISDTDSPQGIIALAKMPQRIDVDFKKGRFIGLENLQDPSNLGAIARSCEALGADGILISKGSCDPYSPKSLRASMGTLLRVPVILLEDFINDIKALSLKSYACVVDANATSICDVEFADGSIVLIGNEANGLTPETIAKSDICVTIPMKGNAESLNASVAGAIAIWEMVK
ncbi:MAG: RNA methyltransferase [Clostridia bacterium]|nr:RNA methyltransferase [Clostridia bacterium]